MERAAVTPDHVLAALNKKQEPEMDTPRFFERMGQKVGTYLHDTSLGAVDDAFRDEFDSDLANSVELMRNRLSLYALHRSRHRNDFHFVDYLIQQRELIGEDITIAKELSEDLTPFIRQMELHTGIMRGFAYQLLDAGEYPKALKLLYSTGDLNDINSEAFNRLRRATEGNEMRRLLIAFQIAETLNEGRTIFEE